MTGGHGVKDTRFKSFRQGRAGSVTGRNPKSLSREEVGAEIGVDAGPEALSAQRSLAFVGFEDVEGGVSDDGEIERGIVFPGSAAVFVEDHVQGPMEVVFNAYRDRSITECAHAHMRERDLRQFTVRGKEKVKAQLTIHALAHNIEQGETLRRKRKEAAAAAATRAAAA